MRKNERMARTIASCPLAQYTAAMSFAAWLLLASFAQDPVAAAAISPFDPGSPPGLGLGLPMTEGAQEPERSGGARWRFQLDLGGGEFEHDTRNSFVDGETDAGFLRLRGEVFSRKGFGGGLTYEGIGSDDDLFVDEGAGRAEAGIADVYAYFAYELRTRRLLMPLRIGPAVRAYELDRQDSGVETTWSTTSLRIQAEPDVALVETPGVRWSLYALASLAIGGGEADDNPGTRANDVDAFHHGFEFGTRLLLGPMRLGLAYVVRDDHYRDSAFGNVDTTFQGAMFTFGTVF